MLKQYYILTKIQEKSSSLNLDQDLLFTNYHPYFKLKLCRVIKWNFDPYTLKGLANKQWNISWTIYLPPDGL